MQDFQLSLRDEGFGDHPDIKATGIMLCNLSVEQVIQMAPFAAALERKLEDRREYEWSVRSATLQYTLDGQQDPTGIALCKVAQPEVLSAGKEELRRAACKAEPPVARHALWPLQCPSHV